MRRKYKGAVFAALVFSLFICATFVDLRFGDTRFGGFAPGVNMIRVSAADVKSTIDMEISVGPKTGELNEMSEFGLVFQYSNLLTIANGDTATFGVAVYTGGDIDAPLGPYDVKIGATSVGRLSLRSNSGDIFADLTITDAAVFMDGSPTNEVRLGLTTPATGPVSIMYNDDGSPPSSASISSNFKIASLSVTKYAPSFGEYIEAEVSLTQLTTNSISSGGTGRFIIGSFRGSGTYTSSNVILESSPGVNALTFSISFSNGSVFLDYMALGSVMPPSPLSAFININPASGTGEFCFDGVNSIPLTSAPAVPAASASFPTAESTPAAPTHAASAPAYSLTPILSLAPAYSLTPILSLAPSSSAPPSYAPPSIYNPPATSAMPAAPLPPAASVATGGVYVPASVIAQSAPALPVSSAISVSDRSVKGVIVQYIPLAELLPGFIPKPDCSYVIKEVNGDALARLGLYLEQDTGVLYGVPKETGIFEFDVEFTAEPDGGTTIRHYQLDIISPDDSLCLDETDYLIEKYIGGGDDLEPHVIDEYAQDLKNVLLEVNLDFYTYNVDGVYIDGVKLVEGHIGQADDDWDYYVTEGSIVITLRAKTLRKLKNDSVHTVAAKFFSTGETGGELPMTRVAQQVDLRLKDRDTGAAYANEEPPTDGVVSGVTDRTTQTDAASPAKINPRTSSGGEQALSPAITACVLAMLICVTSATRKRLRRRAARK